MLNSHTDRKLIPLEVGWRTLKREGVQVCMYVYVVCVCLCVCVLSVILCVWACVCVCVYMCAQAFVKRIENVDEMKFFKAKDYVKLYEYVCACVVCVCVCVLLVCDICILGVRYCVCVCSRLLYTHTHTHHTTTPTNTTTHTTHTHTHTHTHTQHNTKPHLQNVYTTRATQLVREHVRTVHSVCIRPLFKGLQTGFGTRLSAL